MSKWWYITIYRCPDCKAEYERYDHTAPWYDSGLSTCPVIEEFCAECLAVLQLEDEKENV